MFSAWSIWFLIVIYATRVGKGYSTSLSGPTLLYLTRLLNSDVKNAATAYVARSLAGVFGTIVVYVVTKKVRINQLHIIAFLIFIKCVCNLSIPWMTEVWQLYLAQFGIGFAINYLGAVFQSMILRKWDTKISRILMHIFFVTWSVGATVSPLIAEPFLRMANYNMIKNPNCVSKSSNGYDTTFNETYSGSDGMLINPASWTYFIIAIYYFVVALVTLCLALVKSKEREVGNFYSTSETMFEKREEEPFRDLAWIFLAFTFHFFCIISCRVVIEEFLYAVAMCSQLHFSVSNAAWINSLYGFGDIVGGMVGVLVSPYLQPSTISVASVISAFVIMILMVVCGQWWFWVTWFVSFMFGFFLAPMRAAAITWMSHITNISGKYVFVSFLGAFLGTTISTPVSGVLFQKSPFFVIYYLCALSGANILCVALVAYCAKQKNRKSCESASEQQQLLTNTQK